MIVGSDFLAPNGYVVPEQRQPMSTVTATGHLMVGGNTLSSPFKFAFSSQTDFECICSRRKVWSRCHAVQERLYFVTPCD